MCNPSVFTLGVFSD